MNEKLYIENSPQCVKQVLNNAQLFSYSNFSLNSQTTNFMDVCTVSPQNFNVQQNNHNFSLIQEQQSDVTWESGMIPDINKTTKIPDKIEVIEIGNRHLSPSSYCSNLDLLLPDSCKQNVSKALRSLNAFQSECYNESCCQKNLSYSSCAQEKYCNIQVNQDTEFITRHGNYGNVLLDSCVVTSKISNKYKQTDRESSCTYNYYDNKCVGSGLIENGYYFNTTSLPPLLNNTELPADQQTEISNEESDIVVEESDEDAIDFIDDCQNQFFYGRNKCIICNNVYQPFGVQFYFLTEETPLTMSTEKPALQKIIDIVGDYSYSKNYLCSNCLGLINSIDHLQLKLEKLESNLIGMFNKTCLENNIQYKNKTSKNKVNRFIKMPRYKCKLCKKILCLKKYCCYHLKQHKNRNYLCDYCGKVILSRKKFLIHYTRHKKKLCSKIEGFKCSNCDKIFRTNSNKKEHENYCLGTLPFKCKHCDKKFPSATKLKNHITLKHDKKFAVICSICNIGFTRVSDYKSHIVSHSAEKKYSCPKCSKTYKTLSNLNFHIKSHSSSLPFSCHICQRGFMRKEYLEAHVSNHNGIKNFSCANCEKKFVSQKNLDAHLKYHEGTVKKYTCNICGKTMTTGFEEHLRIHNNLREFACEHCDMRFNTKGTLSKHVKKKH